MANVHKPKISIVVPVFNVDKYLSECLDSLINQTYSNLEIILVDDGSTDNSGSICDVYAKRDHRIIVIHQVNGGLSNARNCGLDHVTGDYVMFVDSDDWIAKDTCEITVNIAIKETADLVIFPYVRVYSSVLKPKYLYPEKEIKFTKESFTFGPHRMLYGLIDNELQKPENIDSISTVCTKLYLREIIGEARFTDLLLIGSFEDGLFNTDVFPYVRRAVYINYPFYFYRKTNLTSLTNRHKPDLFDQWQCLYNQLEEKIIKFCFPEVFKIALHNRYCLGIIGLGLNLIASQTQSFWQKSSELHRILSLERYQNAFSALEFKYFPLHWRLFFYSCKYRFSPVVIVMLYVMRKLRAYAN